MNNGASLITANDNSPPDLRPQGDSIGFRDMLRQQELERRLHSLELNSIMQSAHSMTAQAPSQPSQSVQAKSKLPLALFCTMLVAAMSAYCLYSAQSTIICIAALSALVWTALWTSYESTDEAAHDDADFKPKFISEITIITATLAGLGIWSFVSREWGLPLGIADGIAGFAVLTTLTAALLNSRLSLLISACAGLSWIAFYTLVPSINMISIWAYPLIAAFQIFVAGKKGTTLPTVLTLIGAHAWLFWLFNERMIAGDISLLHTAAFSMLIGMAHYRLGKAAGDVHWKSATVHVVFGWSLAIVGAIGLQHYWLGTNTALWQDQTVHPLAEISWQIVGGVCIALIGIAGLIRMAHHKMSSAAVLYSLLVALAAAALFDQRGAIESLVQSQLSMPARPLIGLLIGAAIFASAIAMCVNGARRNGWLMMLAGLAVIAAELAMVMHPNIWTIETSLAFGLWLIGSLCFATLFAADSSSRYA